MSERLYLTDKRSWTLENAALIAAIIHYEHDRLFSVILDRFIIDVVREAIPTNSLSQLFIEELSRRGYTQISIKL